MRHRLNTGGSNLDIATLETVHEQMSEMGYEGYDPLTDEEVEATEKFDLTSFPYQAQYALMLFNILPDKVEGMNGIWLGKEFSGIKDIMDICDIEQQDRNLVFTFLLDCIEEASNYYSERSKKEMAKVHNR